MADKKQQDDLPPIGEIYEHWLTTAQVAQMHNMTVSAVHYLCAENKLRAIKIGSKRRGEWRIDPISARNYKRKR